MTHRARRLGAPSGGADGHRSQHGSVRTHFSPSAGWFDGSNGVAGGVRGGAPGKPPTGNPGARTPLLDPRQYNERRGALGARRQPCPASSRRTRLRDQVKTYADSAAGIGDPPRNGQPLDVVHLTRSTLELLRGGGDALEPSEMAAGHRKCHSGHSSVGCLRPECGSRCRAARSIELKPCSGKPCAVRDRAEAIIASARHADGLAFVAQANLIAWMPKKLALTPSSFVKHQTLSVSGALRLRSAIIAIESLLLES
jgi:hypothetical protein